MSIVIFSHGKESGPNGTKINALSVIAMEYGSQVFSINYIECKDDTERIIKLKEKITQYPNEKLILVGSSMGAYVFNRSCKPNKS